MNNVTVRPMLRTYVTAALLLLGLISCKPTKKMAGGSHIPGDVVHSLPQPFLDSKLKIQLKNSEQSNSARAKLRLQKDAVIWASLTNSTGIEGLRTLIRPDSAFVIDRLKKKYEALAVKDFSKQLGFAVDYAMLQAILLGELAIAPDGNDQYHREDTHDVLYQDYGQLQIKNFINPETKRIEKVQITDKEGEEQVLLTYTDFQAVENFLFPHQTLIEIHYYNKEERRYEDLSISLEHTKVVLSKEPLSFPFSPPARFED
ncbi:DUF4292 domain-containing protein [Eisenibacter elegans]|jgi:hypothetical protein|uniref:DUF4292 domain-containing protein n=1 Tax=Eisenibacter elegans TaxID=997 RepID=UPI00047B3B78|nr:DUF4292 domain-containing protein [Eisenibacter elegans]